MNHYGIMNCNPQYGNVGNLGDILKHAALINLLKLLARHNEHGFAYMETHAFLLNVSCPKHAHWIKEVCSELSLYQSYKDYMDAERAIINGKNYRCSAGLAIDTLKEMGVSNPYLILSEKNHDTMTTLREQLYEERQENHALLADASHLNRIRLPESIDTLFILVDLFGPDNILWETIIDSLKTMLKPGLKVVLELFTFDKKRATVIWPSPPDGMRGPVSFLHRQPYHLAVYSTGNISDNVARCCTLLGWRKSEAEMWD